MKIPEDLIPPLLRAPCAGSVIRFEFRIACGIAQAVSVTNNEEERATFQVPIVPTRRAPPLSAIFLETEQF
jgi:hypothetical protein